MLSQVQRPPPVPPGPGIAPTRAASPSEVSGLSSRHAVGPAPEGERTFLLDAVKGLAIALVVLGHTNQGEIFRGWWGGSTFGTQLDAFIYSFHMPAFFFVSGTLVGISAARRSAWAYIVRKAQTLLYPYLIWAVLLIAVKTLVGGALGLRPPGVKLTLLALLTGELAWFLPALFVASVLVMWLRRLPPLPLFLATCFVAFFWPITHIDALDRGVLYLPFAIAGLCLGPYLHHLRRLPILHSVFLAAVLGAGLFLGTSHVTGVRGRHAGYLPAGFLGTAALLLLGHALETTRSGSLAARAGIASLGIFLLSPYAQGAGRALLLLAHVRQPVVQLVVPTLLAILLPAWIYLRRSPWRIAWLFEWPSRKGKIDSQYR